MSSKYFKGLANKIGGKVGKLLAFGEVAFGGLEGLMAVVALGADAPDGEVVACCFHAALEGPFASVGFAELACFPEGFADG